MIKNVLNFIVFVLIFFGLIIAFSHRVHADPIAVNYPELFTPPESLYVEVPKLKKLLPRFPVASESVFVVNLDTQDVEYAKNENELRSIASITKMMTAYVVLQQPQIDLSEVLTITQEDVNLAKRAHRASNLRAGMHFTRERLLNLALMSSENTAAAALGRTTFKGGTEVFVEQMNAMATELGMFKTGFEDPIGIGTSNVSTASDLVRLLAAASSEQVIRQFSTTKFEPVQLPIKYNKKPIQYHNTNALVGFSDWNILVQKTGFTNAAGHCVIMIVNIQGQKIAVIVLDAPNNQSRAMDAIKLRQWLEQGKEITAEEAASASPYKFVLYRKGKPVPVHHRRKHRRGIKV